MQGLQQELSQERRNLLQSEKATPSQLVAHDRLKKAIEKRKEEELKPRVRNYNDLRGGGEATGFNVEVPSTARNIGRKEARQRSTSEGSGRDVRKYDEEENDDGPSNGVIGKKVKTGVGMNSNIRRAGFAQGSGNAQIIKQVKTAHTKVGDVILL